MGRMRSIPGNGTAPVKTNAVLSLPCLNPTVTPTNTLFLKMNFLPLCTLYLLALYRPAKCLLNTSIASSAVSPGWYGTTTLAMMTSSLRNPPLMPKH
jgi:hypothetical protein